MKKDTEPHLWPTWKLSPEEADRFYIGAERVTIAIDEKGRLLNVVYHSRFQSKEALQAALTQMHSHFPHADTLEGSMRGDHFCEDFTDAGWRQVWELERAPGWPQYRDMLEQEWNEAATRTRDEGLEKHGAAIEAEVLEQLWPQAHAPEPEVQWEREHEASGIKEVSRSDWQMQDDGLTEQFVAVGQGKQGFHYAVFTSYRGGDDYCWSEGPPWSERAFPTQDAARSAAHAEISEVDYENPYEPEEPHWPEKREESTREPQMRDMDLDR